MGKKVYVTKYALTKGILEIDAIVGQSFYDQNIFYARVCDRYLGTESFRVGLEAFLTKEEALKDAEKRRIKKIDSLKKQIKKLENLKFE